MPQLEDDHKIPASYRVDAYHCTERYGYVWVCLEEPLIDIPAIDEARDDSYRLMQEFYEPWQCAGLRVMENELDLAHPTFVVSVPLRGNGLKVDVNLWVQKLALPFPSPCGVMD